MAGLLGFGPAVVNEVVSVVDRWADQVTALVDDATSLLNMIGGLTGGNFGRYFTGARNTATQTTPSTTITGLIAAGSAARASVAASVASLRATAANIDVVGPVGLATAVQATAIALEAALSDPKDTVRIFTTLAAFSTADVTTADAVGVAIGAMQEVLNDLLRRTAVTNLARASALYQPSSFDDAMQLMQAVIAMIENEIDVAGDRGDDLTYRALRALRVAVINDLTSRGADLAHLKVISLPAAMPSLALAYRLYGDTARDAELIGFANPPHPAFMPTDFNALGS